MKLSVWNIFSSLVLILNISATNLLATDSFNNCDAIKKLIHNGSIIYSDGDNNILCQLNADKSFIPASTIKILTAIIAIKSLGLDFKFKTNFLVDKDNNLIIQGFGDPYLLSEEISIIADHIKKIGHSSFNGLILNTASFDKIIIPGIINSTEPYDAPNGALSVNFNTVNVKKTNGKIVSAEEQTPLTPLAIKIANENKATNIPLRLNVGFENNLIYTAELFTEIFKLHAIEFKKPYKLSNSLENSTIIYQNFNSRPLAEMLAGMLQFSNNMQANQIYLTVGAVKYGYPANMQKAKKAAKLIIDELHIPQADNLVYLEGSGINSDNRISARAMLLILNYFKKYAYLLHKKNDIFIKSGTLTGVYNFSGYIEKNSSLYPFVIMLNQTTNNRQAIVDLLK